MTQEALKLALEALEEIHVGNMTPMAEINWNKAITVIKEALAQPEQDNIYGYASRLATAIWQKHYMKYAPKWKPLDTTEGVLTQIDNMTCGLVREKPEQPEQEPVKWSDYELDGVHHNKPPQRTEQEPVATDWERIARVQNAKLMAMCNEAGGFEKLCEVMDKYEKTTPPQPEQEPVALREALASALTSVYVCGRVWSAWSVGTMSEDDFIPASECDEVLDELVSAVTTPPQRKPLTDEEIFVIKHNWITTPFVNHLDFARAIEAAHGIKENT